MFRADLHVHSSCSDGSDHPMQILSLAKAAGLSGLSITDHDTAQAYTPELFARAAELDLELLVGAEISSEWEGSTVHILAYAFEPSFVKFLEQVVHRREDRNRRILEKIKKKGIEIQLEELGSGNQAQIIGRPHIAEALIKKGAASSMSDAFNRYLKDSAPCYASGGKFSPIEVIDEIHRHQGKACLAHPHFMKQGRFLRELLALPFDGLECYYGVLSKIQEAPWLRIAKERQLLATGGSDYHGTYRPHISIGCSWVSEETFRAIQNKLGESGRLTQR